MVKINISGYGKKKVILFEIDKFKNLYVANFVHNKENYYGVVDINGRLVVDFSTCEFIDIFSNDCRKDYCFTRKTNDSLEYESYHLKKDYQNNFYLHSYIKGSKECKCRLISTIKDEYWFVEVNNDGFVEVSLYDVKTGRIITPGFSEISFEIEESRILACVEKIIHFKDDDGENINLASLLAFIDYEGRFITPFYMPEADLYYPSREHNLDKTFKNFNRVIDTIRLKLISEWEEKNYKVNNALTEMFNNPYSEDELLPALDTKILKFKRKCVGNEEE